MFDMQFDQSEIMLMSSFYCGHCAARMRDEGHNNIVCPVCNEIYHVEL